MDAQDIRNLQEAYLGLYQELDEEQVWKEVENWVNSLLEEGYDLSDYTWEEMYESYSERSGLPRSFRPGAAGSGSFMANSYEPDLYDTILSYLLDEGYANTNEAALAIMTNMSEDWRQSIVEAEVLSKKDGVEGTGVGSNFKARAWTDAEKSRYSSVAAKKSATPSATPKPAGVQSKPSTPSATPKPAAVQSKPKYGQKISKPGEPTRYADSGEVSARDKFDIYQKSRDSAYNIVGWYGLDRNDPETRKKVKDWTNANYLQNLALKSNDPKYDPKKISYPEFTPRKPTGREAWDRI